MVGRLRNELKIGVRDARNTLSKAVEVDRCRYAKVFSRSSEEEVKERGCVVGFDFVAVLFGSCGDHSRQV